MKNLLIAMSTILVTFSANAHTWKTITTGNSPSMTAFIKIAKANSVIQSGEGTVSGAFQIIEVKPVVKNESPTNTFTRILKAKLHATYPITGNDGGYSFSTYTKATPADALNRGLQSDDLLSGDKNQIRPVVEAAIQAGLTVVVGGGSGNNTAADIVAVYDLASNQIAYFMSSNFGSDN